MLKGNFSRESISLLSEVDTVAAIPYVSSNYVTERERLCLQCRAPGARGPPMSITGKF